MKVIIELYNINSRIIAPLQVKNLIYQMMSYLSKDRFYSKLYKKRIWDGYIRFFDKNTGFLPTGLVFFLISVLKSKVKFEGLDITIFVDDKREMIEIDRSLIHENMLEGIILRQSQLKSINAILDSTISGRGIIAAFTGSGKTEMLCALCKVIQGDIILIATDLYLAHQLYDRLQLRGIESDLFRGDEENELDSRIIVSNIQMLYSRLKKYSKGRSYLDSKYVRKLKSAKAVLLDEVHYGASESYLKLLKVMTEASHRIGVSATPFKSSKITDMNLMGAIGTIVVKVGLKELIKEGAVSIPYYVFYKDIKYCSPKKAINLWNDYFKIVLEKKYNMYIIKRDKELLKRNKVKALLSVDEFYEENKKIKYDYHVAYHWNIVKNENRNNKICDILEVLNNRDLKILVFVTQIEHGEILGEILNKRNIRNVFVQGDDSIKDRFEIKKLFEQNECKILIATKVFDKGVDLHGGTDAVVFAGAGKSKIDIVQRTGRGARLQKEGWNKFLVIDFMDKGKYIKEHSEERHKILEYFDFNPVIAMDSTFVDKYIDKREEFILSKEDISESRM